MSTPQTWSLVVFCYNEVATVARVVAEAETVLHRMGVPAYEILVVDDGSTDGSVAEITRAAAVSGAVRPIFHPVNRGIGQALRSGYAAARYENLCAVPADGQFDLLELLPQATVPADAFVSFYRRENTTYTPARNALSYANRVVNRWLLGLNLRDVNWVKIYKTAAVQSLPLELESSLVESELCAKLQRSGYRPLEVVSKYLPRTAGQSKGASWPIVRQALRDTLLLRRVLRRFRVKNTLEAGRWTLDSVPNVDPSNV
jgi:glycosyltransferase involved in cell wall biosynthesis